MENYAYATSYPESGNSSPRSREVEYENSVPPWEDQTTQSSPNYKAKFMCSYGGKIHPRPHDNQLSYIGGETKILAVDRAIKFSGMISKLSALSDAADVCFKYQLPGEDLDALISVTNDDDLEHMMHEFDRLYRSSARPARMRLFLFPVNRSEPGEFGSGEAKTDRERFVEALNSGSNQSVDGSSPPAPVVPNNVDFFFGLDKGVPPSVEAKVREPVPEPEIIAGTVTGRDDRFMGSDPVEVHKRIQELQRLQIGGNEQAMYRPKSEDNLTGGAFAGDFYAQKFPENVPPTAAPEALQTSVTAPPVYWPEKRIAGGGFPSTMANTPGHQHEQQQQPMYVIQTPSGMYHAQMPRQMTGQASQGYYGVQRMAPDYYREQPVYNVIPPAASAPAQAQVPTTPPRMSVYTEGMGMMRPSSSNVVGVTDAGYTQVGYDSSGRQVYYTTPGGVAPP